MTTKRATRKKAPQLKPAVSGIHMWVYANCPPENEFILASGERMRNLFDLAERLAAMDHGVFSHHVNHERNDFANWVEHVFGETELARLFRESHSAERHEIHLLKHMLGRVLGDEKKKQHG